MNKIFRFLAVALVFGALAQSCEGGAEESDKTPGVGGGTGGDDKPGGGSTEAGAPKFLEVNPGDGRAEVVWLINGAESDVKYSYFYYTNEAGKTNESLQATGKSTDTLRKVITMSEGKYTLSVKNFYESKKEFSDASSELEVDVYGATYKSTMKPCPATVSYTAAAGGMLTWGEAEDCIGSLVTYVNKDGETIEKFCSPSETETPIEGVNGGAKVSYKSYFLPAANAIDTLVTGSVTLDLPVDADEVIEVSSLKALMPYLKMSNVRVKLAPGTYNITPGGLSTGEYGTRFDVVKDTFSKILILAEGNDSEYDFTDVTFIEDTEIFVNLVGYSEYTTLQCVGNNNHVYGLTIIQKGKEEAINGGCTNIIMDGYKNCFENITLHSTTSYPYGYGEVFGKGGAGTIIKHYKHCGMLVRGSYNHALDCKIHHRAYGHAMFMQGADNPIIDGCYVTGTLSTTDETLSEKGTGSAADKVNFKSTWGYDVPEGWTLSMIEAGIRVYNTGNTIVNGVRSTGKGCSDVTVTDCFVKDSRAAVTLTHSKGFRKAIRCTTIGNERGFAVGTGGIVEDCYSDTLYGPAFGVDYESDSNITVDLTILQNDKNMYNGNNSFHVAYIFGKNHNITFKAGGGNTGSNYVPDDYAMVSQPLVAPDVEQPNMVIHFGGDCETIGNLAKDNNYSVTGTKFNNQTGFKVVVDAKATGNTITSVGDVDVEVDGNNNITSDGKITTIGIQPFVSRATYNWENQ